MKPTISLSAMCCVVAVLAAAPALGQLGVVVTFTVPLNSNAGGDTGGDFTPLVATDGAGNWVAVWTSREPNIAGGIAMDDDILVARSTDNGATWTNPAPLNNNAGSDAGDDGGPYVSTDGAGNWVAVWYSEEPDIAGGIDTDSDVLVARSTDNGATWTDPAPLNNNAASDTGSDGNPLVSTDGAGHWLALWHSDEADIAGGIGTDNDILVAQSTDNGMTWTDPAPLNNNAGGDTGGDSDPQVATDGAGNWVAVWWSDEPDIADGIDTDIDSLVARSTDNGATWTDPAPLNNNAGSDSGSDIIPRIATDGAGHWVVVWDSGEPDIAGGLGLDSDILLARSTDNGETWTGPDPLNNNAGSDTGSDSRAHVVPDRSGNWVAVWHSGEPDIAGGIGTDLDDFVARSADNGATWTDPVPLNSSAANDSGNDFNPLITTDHRGSWVAGWFSDEPDVAGGIDTDFDILLARFALPDCNLNEIGDGQDIADGTSEDCNGNGVPDECDTDTDGDLVIDPCDNCGSVSNAGQSDRDADGTGDACDECPDDPEKVSAGVCGCGESDADANGDGLPDCLDVPTTRPTSDCVGGLLLMIPMMALGCFAMQRARRGSTMTNRARELFEDRS